MQVRHECDWVFFTQGPSRIPAKALAKANHAPATPPPPPVRSKTVFRNLWEGLQVPMKGEDVSMSGKMWP